MSDQTSAAGCKLTEANWVKKKKQKQKHEQWEAMLLVTQWSALSDLLKAKQKNPSKLNVHLSEAQLCLNMPGESWEDIRYPHMLCPLGTGSWQNWELSMDQGWWEPFCWWWSRCSWGPGCYCSTLWDPFCSLLRLALGVCFPNILSPPSLFHSSGSGYHPQCLTLPSPFAYGKGIFVPLPLAQPFCSSCGVHWSQTFGLRSL